MKYLWIFLLVMTACAANPRYYTKAAGTRTPASVASEGTVKDNFSAVCSYYGKKFHGRLTANGEKYDMYGLTCAHKTYPFNSEFRFTDTDTGQSVIVRVNDRGPFIPGRDFDLSYGAAKKIGLDIAGVKRFKVERLK